jgi:hypothetical protein
VNSNILERQRKSWKPYVCSSNRHPVFVRTSQAICRISQLRGIFRLDPTSPSSHLPSGRQYGCRERRRRAQCTGLELEFLRHRCDHSTRYWRLRALSNCPYQYTGCFSIPYTANTSSRLSTSASILICLIDSTEVTARTKPSKVYPKFLTDESLPAGATKQCHSGRPPQPRHGRSSGPSHDPKSLQRFRSNL